LSHLRRPRLGGIFAGTAGVAVALSLAAAPAMAQMTKDQCVDSNTRAQRLRSDGKLSEAREQLLKCADRACPALVRSDCTKRLDDLENAQPTVAFEAKDGAGSDLIEVKVTMDGKPLADRLDGTALAVDPGQHTFTFETAGQPPVTRTLVLTEGEKGRREHLVLGPALPVAPVPPPSTPANESTAPEPAATGGGTQKTLGLVAGGIGVASLAVGGVFGLLTLSQKSQQENACGSPCSAASHAQAVSDHSAGMTDGTISTVSFIAGGVLVLGGAVLFFTARPSSEPPAATGLRIAPSVGPGGGGMLLRGEF
jgi:hypothetical protein